MSSSTRELTEAIAKLSVHGTARTKRTSNTNERVAAEAAMDRFRRNVAEKDPSPHRPRLFEVGVWICRSPLYAKSDVHENEKK